MKKMKPDGLYELNPRKRLESGRAQKGTVIVIVYAFPSLSVIFEPF